MSSGNTKRELSDDERREIALGAAICVTMVATGLYIIHRTRLTSAVNAAIAAQQDVAQITMWDSFDEGVQYGLQLAKNFNFQPAVDSAKEAGQYLFGAFDKPAA